VHVLAEFGICTQPASLLPPSPGISDGVEQQLEHLEVAADGVFGLQRSVEGAGDAVIPAPSVVPPLRKDIVRPLDTCNRVSHA